MLKVQLVMRYVVKKPSECSEEEIEDFYHMVLKGRQVKLLAGLRDRIERARLLAFYYDGNDLVGIAALKVPDATYKESVFEKAKVPRESSKFSLEFGYAVTLDRYRNRGICSTLTKILQDEVRAQNMYATVRDYNLQMKRILRKYGFVRIGEPYSSKTGSYSLELFARHSRSG